MSFKQRHWGGMTFNQKFSFIKKFIVTAENLRVHNNILINFNKI